MFYTYMNITRDVNLIQKQEHAMTAIFIATSRIKDAQKFADYGARAGATFAPFDGQLVAKGKAGDALAGASDHQVAAVVRFADMKTLEAWYGSPDYQALIPLRDEAVDMTLVTYEEPA